MKVRKETFILLSVLFCLVCPCFKVAAQQVHVYYDLHKDSTFFRWEGKKRGRFQPGLPTLRKGTSVQLHLMEFNDFAYEVSVEAKDPLPPVVRNAAQLDSTKRASGSLTDLTRTLESSQFSSGLQSMLLSGLKSRISRGGGRGEEDASVQVLIKNAIEVATKLRELEKQAEQVQKSLLKEARMLEEGFSAERDLVQLAHSWNIPPSEIKKQADDYMKRLFGASGDGLSLQAVLDWDRQSAIAQMEEDLVELKAAYHFNKSELGVLVFELKGKGGAAIQGNFLPEFWDQLQDDQLFESGINHQLKQVQELRQSLRYFQPAYLKTIYEKYQAIRVHPFSYSQTFVSEADRLDLVVTISPKPRDSLASARGGERAPVYASELNQPQQKRKVIQIQQYSGIKFSSGTGISLARFFNPQQLYAARNGIIVSEEEEFIRPLLISSVQVHSDRGRWLTPGVTAGIGIPIVGNDENQSVSFLLGPSLLFGKSQSFSLNAGLMSGKVRRLKAPFRLGDAYQGSQDSLPTTLRSSFGWFVGLAFNL